MMDYDKIYERVLRRGDEILEQRRKKAVKIRHTSYAVSGVCAAVITGVGVWRMTNNKRIPYPSISEIEIISDITTVNHEGTKTTASVAVTDTKTTSAANTTTIINTALTSTVDSRKNTTLHEMTSASTVQTQAEIKQTTMSETQAVNITATVTTTSKTASYEVDPKNFDYTSAYYRITLSPPDESLGLLTKRRVFSYHETNVAPDKIGHLIEKANVNGRYYDGKEYKDVCTDAEFYEIKGYSPYALAAVKFEENGEYYLYFNTQYQPATLEELISAFDLTADDISQTGTYDQTTIENINTAKSWAFLTENTSLPNLKEECDKKGINVRIDLRLVINSPDKPWLYGIFAIDSRGYIWTDINPLGSYYYIGCEKAEEIISYYIE